MKQQQLVIAGSGGQGVVVTGQLLAKAALLEGLNAVQTQSYGIAQRGGFCSAEVIVDADEILFQQVECPSVVVVLSRDGAKKYPHYDGPAIYDCDVLDIQQSGWIGIPLTTLAEQAGNKRAINSAAAGALIALTGVVKLESFLSTLNVFKGAVLEANVAAARAGYAALASALPEGAPHGS